MAIARLSTAMLTHHDTRRTRCHVQSCYSIVLDPGYGMHEIHSRHSPDDDVSTHHVMLLDREQMELPGRGTRSGGAPCLANSQDVVANRWR